jgi:hypothetical protein
MVPTTLFFEFQGRRGADGTPSGKVPPILEKRKMNVWMWRW